ncbi:L-histidine N(alpha)-methyltransferase [Candidatus Pacearchaeota archaeon]|nr:L-histidine N(alpha)-methyltransferase [Candidatus Pacearchaeota archaeon]
MVKNESQKINDLIFKELIRKGHSEKKGSKIWNLADSKLLFCSEEQPQAFFDFEGKSKYQKEIDSQEMNIINNNIKNIKNKIKDKSINIVDLGCGSGKKAAKIIQKLKNFNIRYCPVDINSNLIEAAIDTVRKENPKEVIKMQWIISDFDNIENISKSVRYKEYQKNIFLLLGSTIENLEIHEILYNIRRSMKEGDLLILGNNILTKKPQKILELYKKSATLEQLLINIPKGLGFKEEELEMDIKLKESRIEIYYNLKIDKTIELYGKKIEFKTGDKFLVLLSYKYKKKDLVEILNMYFNEVDMKISEDGSYTLVICKK